MCGDRVGSPSGMKRAKLNIGLVYSQLKGRPRQEQTNTLGLMLSELCWSTELGRPRLPGARTPFQQPFWVALGGATHRGAAWEMARPTALTAKSGCCNFGVV
ncbi:hypothetical protein RRG08_003112 [Elysia crispata]|uniref:Uncharacterized protein n=1 Tax=Elysia crispata TaxID=231223 RepID=A0AAE1B885_9GAST|nr:hypothetical protein RRG08_003112 [Elysia crispata]